MPTVKLNSKNQMVLPKEARQAMNLKGQGELLVVVKGDVTVIMPVPKSYRAELAGAGKGKYPGPYLQRERRTW